jgi:hypothetical protein
VHTECVFVYAYVCVCVCVCVCLCVCVCVCVHQGAHRIAEALALNSTIHTLDLLGNNLNKKVEDMLDSIMRTSYAYVTIPSEFQVTNVCVRVYTCVCARARAFDTIPSVFQATNVCVCVFRFCLYVSMPTSRMRVCLCV